MAKQKTKTNKKLRNRFRFVILNDETFEEKFSLSLTKLNVWVFGGVIAFTLIFLTASAIIYTPLKYFIPGFGDYNYRGQILQLKFKTDSLQEALEARAVWLDNIANVASGQVDTTKPTVKPSGKVDKAGIKLNEVKPEDEELRKEVEDEENFSLSYGAGQGSGMVEEVKQMYLMKPVDGFVTDEFDAKKEHFGVDIAAKVDAPVKAVYDGRVISAEYTLETGYVIRVQHANNLVSVYKHNGRLFKKTDTFVRAGEVIAASGNTGELTTGPHLHFELWYMGRSLNPRDYVVF